MEVLYINFPACPLREAFTDLEALIAVGAEDELVGPRQSEPRKRPCALSREPYQPLRRRPPQNTEKIFNKKTKVKTHFVALLYWNKFFSSKKK